MLHCFIIRFFAGVTVPFSGEKSRHACDYIIMLVMQKQINPFFLVRSGKNNSILMFFRNDISIGNYTVREVLMKNRTRVWRNIYNTASA
jgi:hypothetical protein